jgi:hypothetical protein
LESIAAQKLVDGHETAINPTWHCGPDAKMWLQYDCTALSA